MSNIALPLQTFEYPHLTKIYKLIEQKREFFFKKVLKTLHVMEESVNSDQELTYWYRRCIEKENLQTIDSLNGLIPCTRTLKNNCSTTPLSISFLLIKDTLVPCITRTYNSITHQWEEIVVKEKMPEPNFKEDGYIPLDCMWLNTFCDHIQNKERSIQILKEYMYFKINQVSLT